ncbi:MAG TPA: type IV secretory system conjugative DNA transfer family protein, partial [Alphaproteobacteria bacterium]|nr:type IV secretory system conjugative DNA transfer family protein [Alphaproteobacteria bacterium]
GGWGFLTPFRWGFLIDFDIKQGKILRLKVDHSVVIAPSGAGKGVGIIIPALLDYKGPAFVTDIKGENYEITHKARQEMIKQHPFWCARISLVLSAGENPVLARDKPTH